MNKKEQILAALKSAKMIVAINDNNAAIVYTAEDIASVLSAVSEKNPVVPAVKSTIPKNNPFVSVKPASKTVVSDSQEVVPVQEAVQEEPKKPSTKKTNAFVASVKQKKEAFAAANTPAAPTNEDRIKELQGQKVLKPHEAKELKKLMGDEAYTAWKKSKEQAFLKRLASSPLKLKRIS